jgi:histidyl-tRNA synthetase
MRTECSPTEFLRIAAHTAEHFGFKTVETLRKDPECKNCTTSLPHSIVDTDSSLDAVQGLMTRGLAQYCDERLHALGGPVLLYSIETSEQTGETAVAFHIFNVQKSIAEAILIQTSRALAIELGYNDHTVRINSLGDTDSMTRYGRELTNFLRKRLDLMPDTARELMKQHTLLALQDLVTLEHDLAYKSPNPLEYLSDQSRKHFRDIIEYLDMSETPYEIDSKMLGHHEYYSDALFAIDIPHEVDTEPHALMIRGGRFDAFVERKTKKKTHAVGAVAILREQKAPARNPRFKLNTPTVSIIQLGFGPKVRSLMIIDELRKAGISAFQDLANDSLSAQLRDAERRGVKYVVIIGQKEFVDGTVILRDMEARKQEPIPHDQLVRKLKKNAPVAA